MNKQIYKLAEQAAEHAVVNPSDSILQSETEDAKVEIPKEFIDKFAELIVKEMCGMMEQAEDDAYHCFEPSERPTEYIEWLRDWQERVAKHFGVEE